MSGDPGRSPLLTLKRRPNVWSNVRTMSSGVVFLLFTRLIAKLRCSGVRLSGIYLFGQSSMRRLGSVSTAITISL
jgi:hypothetical protein